MSSNTNTNKGQNVLCKVCEQTQPKPWLIAKGYRIGRCAQCGFAQVLDMPSSSELSDLYETLHIKHIKYRSSQSAQLENQRRLSFLQKHMFNGARVLDAGCAAGDFLAEAAEAFEMYGFDISSAAIAHAKHRLPQLRERLAAQRLEDVDASWQGFDAVCLWDVIEHVSDPVMVIQRMMDRVKPGGYLFMSTPDFGSFTARMMRSYWAFMIPPFHLGYFPKQSFEHLFKYRVPGEIISYETRGKTVDLAFLTYKLNQMSRWLAPECLLNWVAQTYFGRLKLYIPSNDIAYLAVRKPDAQALRPEKSN
jgi:2-polyprenyl-3-methyl-5-hydroxy-6-metoxy-1,4-benzoquinol methylase